jgi:hypothetical protein
MSSNELLLARGKIAELENHYKEFEMKAESLLIQLREILNPFSEFLDMDIERALVLVKEFRTLQLNARECQAMICKIKETYNL